MEKMEGLIPSSDCCDETKPFMFDLGHFESLEELKQIGKIVDLFISKNDCSIYIAGNFNEYYVTYDVNIQDDSFIYYRHVVKYLPKDSIEVFDLFKEYQNAAYYLPDACIIIDHVIVRNFLGYNITIPVRGFGDRPDLKNVTRDLSGCLRNGFTDEESISIALSHHLNLGYEIYSPKIEKVSGKTIDSDKRNKTFQKTITVKNETNLD